MTTLWFIVVGLVLVFGSDYALVHFGTADDSVRRAPWRAVVLEAVYVLGAALVLGGAFVALGAALGIGRL